MQGCYCPDQLFFRVLLVFAVHNLSLPNTWWGGTTGPQNTYQKYRSRQEVFAWKTRKYLRRSPHLIHLPWKSIVHGSANLPWIGPWIRHGTHDIKNANVPFTGRFLNPHPLTSSIELTTRNPCCKPGLGYYVPVMWVARHTPTLKLIAKALENQCLEDDIWFFWEFAYSHGAFAVVFRECICISACLLSLNACELR